MGRKKIMIEKIEDLGKRYVSFSKRKQGLFSKASSACRMYEGSQIAIILFSPTAGKLHTFGPVDPLIDNFLLHHSSLNPPPPPPPSHPINSNSNPSPLLASTTDDHDHHHHHIEEEGKKRSRSCRRDDLVAEEERETKKKKRKLLTSRAEEKKGFLLIKNSETEERLMKKNENMGSSYCTAATTTTTIGVADICCSSLSPSPPVASSSSLSESDDELNEFLNGFADEIIADHHQHYHPHEENTFDLLPPPHLPLSNAAFIHNNSSSSMYEGRDRVHEDSCFRMVEYDQIFI